MKLLLIGFLLPTLALAADLTGRWRNTGDGTVVNFLRVGGQIHQYNSSNYTDQWGRLQYKIDQRLTLPATGEERLSGVASFYDSRGCSFKDLPVTLEFQSDVTINVLMTVPRYKFQTLTERRDRYSPPTVRTRCRILEYVEVPVELVKW